MSTSEGALVVMASKVKVPSIPPSTRTEAELELERRVLDHPNFNTAPYTDHDNLRRFLVARDGHVQAAITMWERWATWYSEYQPKEIREEEVQEMLATGKLMVGGKDREGRGLLYVRLADHDPNAGQTPQSIRAAVFGIERALELSNQSGGRGYMTVVWEHEGCGLKNFDAALLIAKGGLVQILQDFYPERLGALYILNPDWIFQTLWKVVYPFLDERTRSKIKLVKKPADLQGAFDPDELLPYYREKIFGSISIQKTSPTAADGSLSCMPLSSGA